MSENSSSGRVATAAGIGLIALLGGAGKLLLRSGDDLARVASHGGDDLLRSSDDFLRSSDDLFRGGSGGLRHLDDAAASASSNSASWNSVPWNDAGSGVDDASRGASGSVVRTGDRFAGSGTRISSLRIGRIPGGQPLAPLDDVAAQEAQFADTLGTLADQGETAATASRGASPANSGVDLAGKAAQTSGQRNAALAELRSRVAAGRAQLADQMAALRDLKAANRPLDTKLAEGIAARQHERALEVLSRAHLAAEKVPPAELARAAEEVRPAASLSGTAAEAADGTARAAVRAQSAPTTAARAADEPLMEYLESQARRLAVRHGADFLKELLQLTDLEFSREDPASGRSAALDSELPRALSRFAANPSQKLTAEDRTELQREISDILTTADAELRQLESGPGPNAAEARLFAGASRATLVRVQLYYASQALKRMGEQPGNGK